MKVLSELNVKNWMMPLLASLVLVLAGCGGGASTETNAQYNNGLGGDGETVVVDDSPYTGAQCGHSYSDADTIAEVCRFKQYFFDELRTKDCARPAGHRVRTSPEPWKASSAAKTTKIAESVQALHISRLPPSPGSAVS